MSKPTALDLAVHRTFHKWSGGLPAAAAALGKSEQVLRNKVNWTVATNHLTLNEARDAMLMSGDFQILYSLAEELDLRILGPAEPYASFMQELMTAEAAHGDVSRAMADAIRDRRISPRERSEIAQSIRNEIAAKQRLLGAIDAIVEAGGLVSHG
ncbi:MAG TPA: phage regulatory CII family protein [Rhodocyclaceae bacterium]|nr:phage regulatory CII family protein [Rhodocyclaceae bacterium]